MAVRPDDPVAAEVDQADRLVELLVDRDAGVAGREERVVGVVERLPGSDVARARELPDDSLARRDEQDPVVVAVGDQYVSRNRAGLHGRQAEDGLRGSRSGRDFRVGAGLASATSGLRERLLGVGHAAPAATRRSRPGRRRRPRSPRRRARSARSVGAHDDVRAVFALPAAIGRLGELIARYGLSGGRGSGRRRPPDGRAARARVRSAPDRRSGSPSRRARSARGGAPRRGRGRRRQSG